MSCEYYQLKKTTTNLKCKIKSDLTVFDECICVGKIK